jgi:hypothetical protein
VTALLFTKTFPDRTNLFIKYIDGNRLSRSKNVSRRPSRARKKSASFLPHTEIADLYNFRNCEAFLKPKNKETFL